MNGSDFHFCWQCSTLLNVVMFNPVPFVADLKYTHLDKSWWCLLRRRNIYSVIS